MSENELRIRLAQFLVFLRLEERIIEEGESQNENSNNGIDGMLGTNPANDDWLRRYGAGRQARFVRSRSA